MDAQYVIESDLGEGITLRPFREDDAQSVFDVVSRNYEHLRPYMHWAAPDYSMDSAREFIRNSIESFRSGSSMGLAILRAEIFIGTMGLVKIDRTSRRGEIGYWVDKHEEGKGIISRACSRLIEYAFDELQMNRMEIRCSSENLRSSAVPERLGFVKEGVLRQYELRDGRLHDYCIYGLLRSEWPVFTKL
jgi:ribosomal-protein-serine acetyltransferase